MQIGVLTVLYQDKPFEDVLNLVQEFGMDAVELGTGNYPGNAHCNPSVLLADDRKLEQFQRSIAERNLQISALSCQGNPLHPQAEIAKGFHETWRQTVLLAEKIGVDCINVFSGCPGDSADSLFPNWVTCAWPPDYLEVLNWQWEEKLIPYWNSEAEFANQHHVNKIGFEMHPGFMVYNPETLLRLREAVGTSIGANFDPSHLLWQGIDPVEAIKLLGEHEAIFHVHAKDVYLDRRNISLNGVLDTKPYGDIAHRSWTFRSVGYGMDEATWKQIISTLRVAGYDGAISIEHEDALASVGEGFSKAVEMLKRSILRESPGEIWWA
jgi:sugar phosphate isomerase/epimerase